MGYKRIKLSYDFDVLEPFIDSETMKLHYEKHHKGYETKLNESIEGTDIENQYPDLIDLLKNYQKISSPEIKVSIREFGGGLANHNFWFNSLKKDIPMNENLEVIQEIKKHWGSIDEFKKEFAQQVNDLFGSVWVWFVKRKNNSLKIIKTFNQDNPWFLGFVPLLGIDVWEHSYYLKFQNRRDDYLNNFWSVVDWNFVNEQFLIVTEEDEEQ